MQLQHQVLRHLHSAANSFDQLICLSMPLLSLCLPMYERLVRSVLLWSTWGICIATLTNTFVFRCTNKLKLPPIDWMLSRRRDYTIIAFSVKCFHKNDAAKSKDCHEFGCASFDADASFIGLTFHLVISSYSGASFCFLSWKFKNKLS